MEIKRKRRKKRTKIYLVKKELNGKSAKILQLVNPIMLIKKKIGQPGQTIQKTRGGDENALLIPDQLCRTVGTRLLHTERQRNNETESRKGMMNINIKILRIS